MDKQSLWNFIHKIYSISGKVHQIRNAEVTLNMGITANSAILSTLDVISNNKNLKMSEISCLMGITKGAISQLSNKLEQKGLIEKVKMKDNAKEIFLVITDKGDKALEEYHMLHDQLYSGIDELVSKYKAEEQEVIRGFIEETDQFLSRYRKNFEEYNKRISNK